MSQDHRCKSPQQNCKLNPTKELCTTLLLLLSRFSCVRLCDPIEDSHQTPPSLGFSTREHWSGLPFPSPMRESEVTHRIQLLAPPWTEACQAPPSMGFSRQKSTGVGCHCYAL